MINYRISFTYVNKKYSINFVLFFVKYDAIFYQLLGFVVDLINGEALKKVFARL